MEALASALLKRNVSLAVVVLALGIAGLAALLAKDLEQDDDLLAFLPPGNPDVALFYDINERFGGLDVAIVGIEADDLFSVEFLERLARTTTAVDEIEEVTYALSITSVEDFEPDPEMGGIRQSPLAYPLPRTPAEVDAIRAKVMSRAHVVGNLVSPTGDAVNLICFLGADVDPRLAAEKIRRVVGGYLPNHPKYWGGTPFISGYIYDTSQRDLDRLTPWAVLTILVLLMVTFGDLRGTLLALLSTGMGIAVANGLMAALDVRYNIVLSSMPVLLFAIGSAYSIHILAHYYAREPREGRDEALRKTMIGIGPVVLAAGLTTVAGLLSFLAMDIEPMRTFGLFTAIGIFTTLVLSLTFVPAVIRLTGPKRKRRGWTISRPMIRVVEYSTRNRAIAAVVVGGLAFVGAVFVTEVETRMDNATFFDAGSPPDQAERFLDRHFGGSVFLQLLMRGDMEDPQVLREVQYIADRLVQLSSISQAIHVADAVSLANEAMEGQRRVPDTRAKVALLLGLMRGNRSVEQLITEDRDEALLQLKVSETRAEDVERVLHEVEIFVAAHRTPVGPERPRELVLTRIGALGHNYDVPIDLEALDAHLDDLPREVPVPVLADAIEAFMGTEEFLAELPPEPPDIRPRLAHTLAALAPDTDSDELATVVADVLAVPRDELVVDDVVFSVEIPLQEIRIAESSGMAARALIERAGIVIPPEEAGRRYTAALAAALVELEQLPDEPGAGAEVEIQVSGLPVLHRGLSRSVTANQWRSLSMALGLVLLIMIGLFRSITGGLLATTPTFLTLLVVYGAMGALEVNLDIGTSMLACLIIGAGVDYAVHMLASWRARDGRDAADGAVVAARSTAPAIWTNAAMVAAGFYVLTLGEARPLQNVGLLTASAMLVAASATFVAIPVLARRRSYGRGVDLTVLEDPEDTDEDPV